MKAAKTACCNWATGLSFIRALFMIFGISPGTATAEVLIPTVQGKIRGLEAPGIKKFLGIPYATPPVGDLRWMPPRPHVEWSGVFDATEFGSHCAQTTRIVGTPSASEDCLFLNVYVPTEDDNSTSVADSTRSGRGSNAHLRAVMVWIHGGDSTAGESDDFDGGALANMGDVIVVTINYRLGVLGFLSHPALTAESPDHASGNYGILDQQLALDWVQKNIRAFGGEPDNVTVFGQSAGRLSVLANMASPGAKELSIRPSSRAEPMS